MLNTIIDVFEQMMLGMAVVAAGLILAMSGWITYDVLTRYFLNFASPWAFDLSEYALVWITFWVRHGSCCKTDTSALSYWSTKFHSRHNAP